MMRKFCLLVCLIALRAISLWRRIRRKSRPKAALPLRPVANSADVASRDAIMAATYDVISGDRLAKSAIGIASFHYLRPGRGLRLSIRIMMASWWCMFSRLRNM